MVVFFIHGFSNGVIHASAKRFTDGENLDRALYTLYEALKGNGKTPSVTATKNGIRVTYFN